MLIPSIILSNVLTSLSILIAGIPVSATVTDDETLGCLPQLADRCFKETYDKLPCRLKREIDIDFCPSSSELQNNEFKEFCSALDDSLACSADIIDTDCSIKNGRAVFDLWLDGLRAVSSFLCFNEHENLKVLTDNAKCWNSAFFFQCVNTTVQIQHVVDIMNSPLDLKECISLIFGLAECNLYAGEIPENETCSLQIPRDLVKELIHKFLAITNCNNYNIFSRAAKNHDNYYLRVSLIILILYFVISCFNALDLLQ